MLDLKNLYECENCKVISINVESKIDEELLKKKTIATKNLENWNTVEYPKLMEIFNNKLKIYEEIVKTHNSKMFIMYFVIGVPKWELIKNKDYIYIKNKNGKINEHDFINLPEYKIDLNIYIDYKYIECPFCNNKRYFELNTN